LANRQGGIEKGRALGEARRRKHYSERSERGAWFERAKLSHHHENLRFSDDSEPREPSARGLSIVGGSDYISLGENSDFF
jgi:hypothetical protein